MTVPLRGIKCTQVALCSSHVHSVDTKQHYLLPHLLHHLLRDTPFIHGDVLQWWGQPVLSKATLATNDYPDPNPRGKASIEAVHPFLFAFFLCSPFYMHLQLEVADIFECTLLSIMPAISRVRYHLVRCLRR